MPSTPASRPSSGHAAPAVRPACSMASTRSRHGSGSTPSLRIIAALPMTTRVPSTVPVTPCPGRLRTPLAAGRSSPARRGVVDDGPASGCSLPAWTAAASGDQLGPLRPRRERVGDHSAGPCVSVPVLSKTTVSTRCARSSASTSRIRMPARAPAPVPATSAVGVARPSAQGQAMTSTETAATSAGSQRAADHHPADEGQIATTATTTGTKTALTRSTSRCTGALPVWAFSTRRMMRASVESAPTASPSPAAGRRCR